MYFVDTSGDFSHTVEGNSLKSVWHISIYILASTPRVELKPYSVLIFFCALMFQSLLYPYGDFHHTAW